MIIRLLRDDAVGADAGLAADEALLERQGAPDPPPPALRLYSYRSHCALVGRFQDLDAEVDLPECALLGVAVNRRPTGGGAILMGADQLGVAFAGPGGSRPSRAILHQLAEGVLEGLRALGIEAELRGKNDLAVGGRKIAGLGVCRGDDGAFLFHASVLGDLDVGLMLRVLRIPVAKLGGDGAVRERLTTVRQAARSCIGLDELREAVHAGFERTLGASALLGELDDDEARAAERLVREKYGTQAWVRERSGGPARQGTGCARAPGGLVRAWVSLAGAAIASVALGADFLEAAPGLLAAIEARLRWGPGTPEAIAAAVAGVWDSGRPDGVDPEHVALAVRNAVAEAARRGGRSAVRGDDPAPGPYACFVGRLDD